MKPYVQTDKQETQKTVTSFHSDIHSIQKQEKIGTEMKSNLLCQPHSRYPRKFMG